MIKEKWLFWKVGCGGRKKSRPPKNATFVFDHVNRLLMYIIFTASYSLPFFKHDEKI